MGFFSQVSELTSPFSHGRSSFLPSPNVWVVLGELSDCWGRSGQGRVVLRFPHKHPPFRQTFTSPLCWKKEKKNHLEAQGRHAPCTTALHSSTISLLEQHCPENAADPMVHSGYSKALGINPTGVQCQCHRDRVPSWASHASAPLQLPPAAPPVHGSPSACKV